MINVLRNLIKSYDYNINNEKDFQDGIEMVLCDANIAYHREYFLSREDKPDFFLKPSGTAMEIKIKGSQMQILRQLKRYANHEQVKEIILITTKKINMPETLSGKPCHQVWITVL